jgi:hypothetical protein
MIEVVFGHSSRASQGLNVVAFQATLQSPVSKGSITHRFLNLKSHRDWCRCSSQYYGAVIVMFSNIDLCIVLYPQVSKSIERVTRGLAIKKLWILRNDRLNHAD